MIYLASPYTHKDPAVMTARYQTAATCAAHLTFIEGKTVFSPIVYGHQLSDFCNIATDYKTWLRFNSHMLSLAEEVYVLTIDGWVSSKGVTHEIMQARLMHKPLRFINVYGEQTIEDN